MGDSRIRILEQCLGYASAPAHVPVRGMLCGQWTVQAEPNLAPLQKSKQSPRLTPSTKLLDDLAPIDHRKRYSVPTAMKAARGFALGLQLIVAVSSATSALADTDGIPDVGIGAVHPICDPLQEECTSSDAQVQDDIIAGLQADDKVTGRGRSYCLLPSWYNRDVHTAGRFVSGTLHTCKAKLLSDDWSLSAVRL